MIKATMIILAVLTGAAFFLLFKMSEKIKKLEREEEEKENEFMHLTF